MALLPFAACPLAALAAPDLPSAPASQAQAQEDEPDKVVVVKAQRQHYRSLSATGATKTDTLLKDLPQSVRVLTADLLRDVGVTSLAGALDLSSGISRQSDLGGLWDSYAMRGFTGDPNFGSDYLVNGFSSSRGYNGLRDTAGSNSIEVLKGPGSALYGRGEPGGTVNINTKKPRFTPARSAELSLGSHHSRRAAIDLIGPLPGPLGENLALRLNASHQHAGSFRDNIDSERSFFSPSLLWLIGDHTTLSYEIEATRQKTPFDRGVAAVNGRLGTFPNSRFLGEPGDGRIGIHSLGQQLFVRHELNEDWSLQAGLSYRDSELAGYSTEANNLLADGRTLRRQRRWRDFSATGRSARIELLGQFASGPLTHHTLFGIDGYRFDDSRVQLRRNPSSANPYAIDILAPVYGAVADPLAASVDTRESQRARGLYLQDQIDLGPQWKALAGVRHDRYDQSVVNRRQYTSNAQSLGATSPRLGLVYQPHARVSLYASAARGFRPNSGVSIDNTAFPAEQSRSYEVGAKLESTDAKLSGTVALYRIDKENVLTTNPANTDFAIPAGAVASKGLELDVSGELARDLRLSAAYAYTDAAVSRGDNSIVSGSRLPNVAKHSASVLLVPSFTVGNASATLGGGLNYVGERAGDVAVSSQFRLPAYTTARLVSSYAPNPRLRVALHVDNLFNKAYYASSYSQVWVAPGTERNVTLSINYRF